MTTPDLQRVIEEAIAGETEYPVNEHIAHQARAVLAALTEAGTVEWGVVRYGRPAKVGSEAEARKLNFKLGYQIISRLTLPWERAE